jgi:hypothetical protein
MIQKYYDKFGKLFAGLKNVLNGRYCSGAS